MEKKRKLVDVFPEPVRKAWNEWELRVMVLLSLALQISLLFYGGRRKYISSRRFRIFICSAYLMADFVPTIALGVLSNSQGITSSCSCSGANKSNPVDEDGLTTFWASFLLLHLGGPDTITAYAFADNELWIRHLFGLVVQTLVALYIILMAWQGTWLSFLAIPMFLVGIIKYGERTWALSLASCDQFSYWEDPHYANFMEEMRLEMIDGYHVSANEVIEVDGSLSRDDIFYATTSDDAAILLKARSFLNSSRLLFLDLVISLHDRKVSRLFFRNLNPITAFRVIEVELGFAYDIFYTKAPINYTRWGFFLHSITSFLTFSVFVAFSIVVHLNLHKHLLVDLVISYILLVGAMILQLTEFLIILSSDWTSLWLSEHCKPRVARAISCLLFQPKQKNRWSKSMNQYNLLTYCLKQKPLFPSGVVTRLLPFSENLTSMIQ